MYRFITQVTPLKNQQEKQPFEDVSPFKNGDFPAIAMLLLGVPIYFRPLKKG